MKNMVFAFFAASLLPLAAEEVKAFCCAPDRTAGKTDGV